MIGFVMNRDRFAVQLGIIICTRNRPKFLENLLKSISESMISPKQIVLVSSGIDIKNVVSRHSKNLNLKHIHTERIGQSNQKVIGITSLDNEIDWVFFLDDDLLLMPDTIYHVLEKINQVNGRNTAGIGTRIVSLNDQEYPNESVNSRIFKHRLGRILKSGRALSYQSQLEVNTEWLNGASIWNKKVLKEYQLPILDSKYAAYEDVIFSTQVSKKYKLVYEPQIRIIEQISHSALQQNFSAYSYINLWTGYFVCIDSRTRLTNFKFLVVLRFLKFLTQKKEFGNKEFKELIKTFRLTWRLIKLPNEKLKSKEIILKLIKGEITSNP
jgi:glycosyltransferase involved in cell wall biosynthesis